MVSMGPGSLRKIKVLSAQGQDDFNEAGYGSPTPLGHGVHHYHPASTL